MNHVDHHSDDADYTFIESAAEIHDFIRVQPPGNNSGSIGITLPDAEVFPGVRITIRHYGGTNYGALINPQPNQRVEGSTSTYTLSPGNRITLQSGVYAGVPGWEAVSD